MKFPALAISSLALALAGSSCAGEIAADEDTLLAAGDGFGPGTGAQATAFGPGQSGASASGAFAGAGMLAGGTLAGAGQAGGRINLAGSPQYYRMVGLTKQQWINSVRDIFGMSALPSAIQAFQDAVSGTTDFTNNELVLGVDSRSWSDFQAAAEELAQQVVSEPRVLSALYPGADGPGFIQAAGLRLYRRPLVAQETERLAQLFDLGAAMTGDQSPFAKGAAVVLEAMLQSPHFLYRVEMGLPGAPLSGYEVAAKLSLWLRNTSPDSALLDAAASGQLDSPQGVAAAAQQMLDEPAAAAVMREFHGQLLHFDRFASLSKVGVRGYNEEINPELAESAYLFFDKIFRDGGGVSDIFLSTSGFVGPHMAPFYGQAAVASGFEERQLGVGRLGYFSQLPFLMLYAHNDGPDAIHRGVSVSLDVLCAPLGPPAAVIPPLPMRRPGQTNRMRVDEHTSVCGGACHNDMINPLGFAFENFDGMGQYRTEEDSGGQVLPIDASGSFNFVGGQQSWQNATELMEVLAAAPQSHLCYAKKLAGFGLQRDIVAEDLELLDTLAGTSIGGGSIKQVILTLVQSDAFRSRSGGTP